MLPNRAVDIRYRPSSVIRAARALLQYWHYSSDKHYRKLVPEYAALIMQSLDTHDEMIRSAGAEALIRKAGYLKLFRTQKALDEELTKTASDSTLFGVEFEVLNRQQLAQREPSLSPSIVGAIHWKQLGPSPIPAPWSKLTPRM